MEHWHKNVYLQSQLTVLLKTRHFSYKLGQEKSCMLKKENKKVIVQRNSLHTLLTFLTEYLQQDKQLQILSRHAPCLSHQRAAVHHQGWKPDRWLLHCGPSEDHEAHCRCPQPFHSTATERWSETLSQQIGDSSSFRCSSGGLSENLRRIFPKHNIIVHFSPGNTLRLLHPKDKTLKHQLSNVVHTVQSLSL